METSPIFVILLVFSTLFASAYGDQAIDCGSSERSYTDDNGITWNSDDDLISTGKSYVVPNGNSVDQVLSTLRAFTTRKKNCYSLSATQGDKVLVRTQFYYGNYDKKSAPPTFDLQFDGNHWSTVVTKLNQSVSHETIYITKFDYVSVCLAQTQPNQFPFISALQVSTLESDMYKHIDGNINALYLTARLGYGLTNAVRYDDDEYDRIWEPRAPTNGLQGVKSDAEIDNSAIDDRPPSVVMQNAITTTNKSSHITHSFNLPSPENSIYANFYFAELLRLGTTEKRSFVLQVNNLVFDDSSIVPSYESVKEYTVYNITTPSKITFSFIATSDSTLPPMINAMELFRISDPLTDGTYTKDVEGLIELQDQFPILKEWTSDPCLPSPYSWEWISCSSDPTPRVTALDLSGYNLSGDLPDFSSMTALVTIDLHNNSLTGEIPEFLGILPNLKELNLADNLFTGAIPSSITSNKKIKLTITGNPNSCTSGENCKTPSTSGDSSDGTPSSSSSGSKSKSKLPVILGAVISAFVVFWIIVGAIVIMQQRRKKAAMNALTAGQTNAGGDTPMLNNQQPIGMGNNVGQIAMNQFKFNVHEQMCNENNNNSNGENQNNRTYYNC